MVKFSAACRLDSAWTLCLVFSGRDVYAGRGLDIGVLFCRWIFDL